MRIEVLLPMCRQQLVLLTVVGLLQKKDPKSEVTYASAMAAVRHGVSPKVMTRFLALGLPGGVMMGVDAASFDVTTVMASVLGIYLIIHIYHHTYIPNHI